jgi:SpoU rRNA methylase family enzyme
VAIADLDIVNPYFRSREADEELSALSIRTLNPRDGYKYADLPIILPEIKGAIEEHSGKVVLDVGGDDVGARVLSSLGESFERDSYELLLVVNARRPFTGDVDSCQKLMKEIEAAARLQFTGFISNTHLLTETTSEVVLSGLNLTRQMSERTGLPVVFLSAKRDIVVQLDPEMVNVPVLTLNRLLLKPWERQQDAGQRTEE